MNILEYDSTCGYRCFVCSFLCFISYTTTLSSRDLKRNIDRNINDNKSCSKLVQDLMDSQSNFPITSPICLSNSRLVHQISVQNANTFLHEMKQSEIQVTTCYIYFI